MMRVSRKPAETPPGRIEKLAKLPLFLDMRAKRAVVAGGSEAAAWKAELLMAAGAQVTLLAANAGGECLALLGRDVDDGRIDLVARDWTQSDLAGAAIAVIATDDLNEAQLFARAARDRGAICSVIDKPDFSDAQFGAIVNRSPVVIAISTDGAAPILAQAIRRRIEIVLPPALAAWARLAQSIRRRVAGLMPAPAARRTFWERFSDWAFLRSEAEATEANAFSLMRGGAGGGRGSVTLVGAGPGDAELLTVKALRALQSADVILFDDLVSPEVLELARREAKRLMVGKRGDRPSCKQDEINQLMIKLARQGRRVVRLKSGDPMIFGRAGEEIAALEEAGIAVTIVPGITAAVAAAASLGVSLTHRLHAHAVRFITGRSRHGGLPDDLDWRALACPETTNIFYMAGHTCADAAAKMMAAGLPGSTPVAIVAAVSRPQEQRWIGRLDRIAAGLAGIDLRQPVLIGIGAVFETAQRAAALDRPARTA